MPRLTIILLSFLACLFSIAGGEELKIIAWAEHPIIKEGKPVEICFSITNCGEKSISVPSKDLDFHRLTLCFFKKSPNGVLKEVGKGAKGTKNFQKILKESAPRS